MEALGREGIGDALMQTFEALRQYFDADCVVLAYAKRAVSAMWKSVTGIRHR